MVDMTKSIEAKSDQLNADDLMGGREMVIKITKVSSGSADQPIRINYEGDNGKPFYPCKSMRRVLVSCWGTKGEEYVGKSMKLYRDPDVKFGGIAVGGIRIREVSHIEEAKTMALTATRGSKKVFIVKPLKVQEERSLETLISQGETESAFGQDSYKKFISTLTAQEKEKVRDKHPEWTKKAKEADAAKQTDDDFAGQV